MKTDIGHIFSYILERKAFSTQYIGQYKIRKAYSFFKSGFVDKVFVKIYNIKIFIKSSVVPSQRINNETQSPWILCAKSGEIITAFCSCTAGVCQCCNHVVAVLNKIEYANKEGLTEPTCSEKSCV